MGFRGRPLVEKRLAVGDGIGAQIVQREAVGQIDRRRDDFLERHRAEFAQRNQRGVHHARHQRRHQARSRNDAFQSAGVAFRDLKGLQRAIAEHLRGSHLRHGAHAGDGVNFPVLGANQDGRFAAEAVMRELAHRTREHGGDAHVHRVAALVVGAHPGFGCVLTARGHRAMHAADRLAQRALGFPSGLRHAQSRQRENDQHSGSLHEVPQVKLASLYSAPPVEFRFRARKE